MLELLFGKETVSQAHSKIKSGEIYIAKSRLSLSVQSAFFFMFSEELLH